MKVGGKLAMKGHMNDVKDDRIVPWLPAPHGIPTDEERFQMVLRLFKRSTTSEVALYAHGTVMARYASGPGDVGVDDLLRIFDAPHDGSGGPLADLHPTAFDDGSVLFAWSLPDPTLGCAFSALTRAELELHQQNVFTAGRWARQQRGRDARSLAGCMTWRKSP